MCTGLRHTELLEPQALGHTIEMLRAVRVPPLRNVATGQSWGLPSLRVREAPAHLRLERLHAGGW